jgi:CheY-like chemotaxis protein
VLVVDDEPIVRSLVQRILTAGRYEMRCVGSAAEGLVAVRSGRPFDLLLTDYSMPEMRGDELARLVRQHHPAIKVLYLTGDADKLLSLRGTLWPGEALLEKPVSQSSLLEAVSLCLFGHRDGARLAFGTTRSSDLDRGGPHRWDA